MFNIKSFVRDAPSPLGIIVRTFWSRIYQPLSDVTVLLYKCSCIFCFGCLFFLYTRERLMLYVFRENTTTDTVFSVFCVHLYKSKRMKPFIFLNKLIKISCLILQTPLYVYLSDALFSSFLCCKAAQQFHFQRNDLLIWFSNATSAAHISESIWFNNIHFK